MENRLERLRDEAIFGGVAAGLARYFNIDRTLVRLLFVIGLLIPHFSALIIYIVLWVALPERRFGVLHDPLFSSTQSFSPMNPYNPSTPDRPRGNLVFGAVLIGLGVLFLLDRWFDINFSDLWPIVLIGIGVWLILKDRVGPNRNDPFNTDQTNKPL